ncbi:hypothetical protein [Actinoplanes sp. NBRC 101535]|uniref:hypothetical protein n=1 Tax=Actinoplanes sp. NBRC 101535 TaxID=3032196 RepID=UPI00255226B3|nr:hypothetical protein [Actinoplanes sp. NBRC 101535]
MSRTDKTRPWWVQLTDAPGRTCMPQHDHRFGPCTLPDEITPTRPLLGVRRQGCRWEGTAAYWVRRCESHGVRESQLICRTDRRRDRHRSRYDLREQLSRRRGANPPA